ncbi:hypothetical protein KAW18_03745 [candidate division WOR-3 bacterium]|nr:hypothetical protein [candidate division WOR-3 bacterium]
MFNFKWKVQPIQNNQTHKKNSFGDFYIRSDNNIFPEIVKNVLPLELIQLTHTDLEKQFVVQLYNEHYSDVSNNYKEYTSRELMFKFYDAMAEHGCKTFCLVVLSPLLSIEKLANLLLELPPVYIFHSNLILGRKQFSNLSDINVLNALYSVDLDEIAGNNCLTNLSIEYLFWNNLHKIVEADLNFYFRIPNKNIDFLNPFKDKLIKNFGNYTFDNRFLIF